MRTVYLIYSVPDLDSSNCDMRIERALRLPQGFYIVASFANCQRYIERHSGEQFPEFEFLEVWQDGKRIDVIHPVPQEVAQ